ncbi:MAG: amidohydrolase family protein [Saprospiraceae bacterium]
MPLYHSKLIVTSSDRGVLKDHVISTTPEGTILSILPLANYPDKGDMRSFEGIIVPGFINAHCHLELSHMKAMIPTGTGLVEFIRQIVTRRNSNPERIAPAIHAADHEMYTQGIVAVGDISNGSDAFETKHHSKLLYHTFVEAFDLMQADKAQEEMDKSFQVFNHLLTPSSHKKSIVPHATYSVSDKLFELIRSLNQSDVTTSIHHQETDAENEFISTRTGLLVNFFQGFGLNLDLYIPTNLPASSVPVKYMSSDQKTLLVHNTMSGPTDIDRIETWNKNTYWVTCPNANLYIENRLPHYQFWLDKGSKVCIGTDSLASNWQLSILEEMKTIQKYQSYVPFTELIKWATINGAVSLGFDKDVGSIEPGKTPGLVYIDNFDVDGFTFSSNSRSYRII